MNLLLIAIKYYGTFEVEGPNSNEKILDWIHDFFPSAKDDSLVAWCSIFMHMIAKEAGYKILRHGHSGLARSWLAEGQAVPIDEMQVGDIVIFWRGALYSRFGHVAIYVNDRGKDIRVLGGNQSNGVNIRSYPKNRIIGVRRLVPRKEIA